MTGKEKEAKHLPAWSWVLAAAGLALVTGSAGFMLYQAVAGESSPPELVVETESIVPSGSGHLVRFRVTNRGRSVAAHLTVEGTLKQGNETIEASTVTLDYVPSLSDRRGGLIFSKDPRGYALEIRATGYRDP